ncbi:MULTISPECIES: AI-2E family transporter [unclassified Microbacterium]|uniref:AI-2E family transporter n=1 Tax=unclassified Microbacterium TaxID=2609290 RepID=UPI000EAAB094|nr:MULTISPECIES: AI-2E family transporter [unclassified Microbacterium]MBT2484072.1 AI-2E family transporter [Microbacterium sp. ISL-108]RKN67023.1 AI-2E family transporter [Microbacterium sp. CGR2]
MWKRTPPRLETQTKLTPGVWSDSLGRVGARCAQVILILILATAAVYAMVQLKLVVIPVLIALIMAAAVGPLVNFLHRRNVPRTLGTWIALLGALVILGGVITGIVFAVRSQWSELVDRAGEGLEDLQTWFAGLNLPIDQDQITEVREGIIGFFTTSEFGSGALAGVTAVGEVLAGSVLVVVILFFFLKDGDRIWAFLTARLQGSTRRKTLKAGSRIIEVLGGYVRGTAIVAAVDAIVIGAALLILQVPLALPLAVLVFIGAFIPIVGATVAGILAALVALVANGPVVALIVIIVVIAVNQLEGDLLQPVVMGKSLKLHALVILLALTIGTILGGIIGAVIAVPIAASAWAAIKIWFGEDETASATDARRVPPRAGPTAVS